MRRDVTRNRPKEGCDLAGYRGDGDRRLLALGRQPPVASTQASLCLPGNFSNLLWQLRQPCLVDFADPCRVPVSPRGFDQCLASADVARLGDPALLARIPGRTLGRHETQECHQLARMLEPTDVAR